VLLTVKAELANIRNGLALGATATSPSLTARTSSPKVIGRVLKHP
jgi:hypothetical protein